MKKSPETHTYYPYIDIARYILALGIITSHFFILNNYPSPLERISSFFVAGFFTISGFVVYPTFRKSISIGKYIKHRARNILPPYFFIVILCAVGLSFISTLPFNKYFLSPDLYKYLAANLSFLNWLHPSLPGVFEGSEFVTSTVNASLWTMKVDWCLYLSVPVIFAIIRRLKIKIKWMLIFIVVFASLYHLILFALFDQTQNQIYDILSRQFIGQMGYFYAGMLIYLYRQKFQQHIILFTLSGGILFVLSLYVIPYGRFLICPFAFPTMLLGLGLMKKTDAKWKHRYNFSFEMYLFRSPIIQLSIYLGIGVLPKWQNYAIILLATILLSITYKFFSLYLKSHTKRDKI